MFHPIVIDLVTPSPAKHQVKFVTPTANPLPATGSPCMLPS